MAEVKHVYKIKGSRDKQTDGQAASEGRHNEIPWKGGGGGEGKMNTIIGEWIAGSRQEISRDSSAACVR